MPWSLAGDRGKVGRIHDHGLIGNSLHALSCLLHAFTSNLAGYVPQFDNKIVNSKLWLQYPLCFRFSALWRKISKLLPALCEAWWRSYNHFHLQSKPADSGDWLYGVVTTHSCGFMPSYINTTPKSCVYKTTVKMPFLQQNPNRLQLHCSGLHWPQHNIFSLPYKLAAEPQRGMLARSPITFSITTCNLKQWKVNNIKWPLTCALCAFDRVLSRHQNCFIAWSSLASGGGDIGDSHWPRLDALKVLSSRQWVYRTQAHTSTHRHIQAYTGTYKHTHARPVLNLSHQHRSSLA